MKRVLLLVLFSSTLAFPSPSHAQVQYGGLDVFMMPCTCSPGIAYHWFAPLFLGPVPITGAMAAPMAPNLFSFFILHPGAWALGLYLPGVQSCWMYAVAACFPLPVIGTITSFTGTSP